MKDADIITVSDAHVLNQARDILEGIVQRCQEEGWKVDRESFAHGKVAAAADHAADSIFDALNVMHAYLDSVVACNAIDRRQDERQAAREAAREAFDAS